MKSECFQFFPYIVFWVSLFNSSVALHPSGIVTLRIYLKKKKNLSSTKSVSTNRMLDRTAYMVNDRRKTITSFIFIQIYFQIPYHQITCGYFLWLTTPGPVTSSCFPPQVYGQESLSEPVKIKECYLQPGLLWSTNRVIDVGRELSKGLV